MTTEQDVPQKVRVNFVLDADVAEFLRGEAEHEDRSLSAHANRIFRAYMSEESIQEMVS